MTAPLLSVGAPVVRQSVFGDWLVDDGSLVPQRASDRPAAFDEAAARSSISPPAGTSDPIPGAVTATAGAAGSYSGAAVPPPSGTVPESVAVASPDPCGSGTTFFSSQPHGAAGGEGSAGSTAFEAAVVPATNPTSSNGAST